MSLLLDSAFWSRFSKTTWEKRATAFRDISSPLLELDEAEIFLALVLYSDRCRKLKTADGLKLYIEGQRQFESEVLRHLPKKSDQSLTGYHQRMNAQFADYCLVCDELLQVNHAKQDRLAEFTEALYKAVGFPNRFAEMGLYLGNYRKTPFGVHVDGCGVFSFPVVGKKTFRIWKPDYVAKHPSLERAFTYTKHKAHSQVLSAQPGDMTYWPSSDWHVAESDGSFSATWSLGIWVDQRLSVEVGALVTSLLTAANDLDAVSGTTPFTEIVASNGQMVGLPDLYQNSIDRLKALSSDQLGTAFLKSWMVHTSKQGFKNQPPFLAPVKSLNRSSVIKLRNSKSQIRWMKSTTDQNYYYSFAGVVTEGSRSVAFLKLVKKLNAGDSLKVGASLKSSDKLEIKNLRLLASVGALSI